MPFVERKVDLCQWKSFITPARNACNYRAALQFRSVRLSGPRTRGLSFPQSTSTVPPRSTCCTGSIFEPCRPPWLTSWCIKRVKRKVKRFIQWISQKSRGLWPTLTMNHGFEVIRVQTHFKIPWISRTSRSHLAGVPKGGGVVYRDEQLRIGVSRRNSVIAFAFHKLGGACRRVID